MEGQKESMTEDEEFEFRHRLEQEQVPLAPSGPPATQEDLKAMLGKAAIGPFANTLFGQIVIDPKKAQAKYGGALPVIGGMAGGPIGAALGETANIAAGTAMGNSQTPTSPLGIGASVIGSGVAQEPKILGATLGKIPGVSAVGSKVAELTSALGSKAGKALSGFGQALTGAKAKDLEQAAKQGLSTYGAPSMEKAQEIFGKALAKEGVSAKPPLENIIDPALSTARKTALHVGKLLEEGIELKPQEALLGRQAIDRIYNATPMTDRATRGHLSELRSAFDAALSNKEGGIKEASRLYRQAIVKNAISNPLKITKQGQMSAVAPMIASLAASTGLGSGHGKEGGLGALGYLAASSPAVAGALATGGGSAGQALGALANNPAARQVLFQLLQRLRSGNQAAPEAQQ